MQTIKLSDEEYKLLKDCLKWNLFFYKERVSTTTNAITNIAGGYNCQKDQIKKMGELNGKI